MQNRTHRLEQKNLKQTMIKLLVIIGVQRRKLVTLDLKVLVVEVHHQITLGQKLLGQNLLGVMLSQKLHRKLKFTATGARLIQKVGFGLQVYFMRRKEARNFMLVN